MHIQATKSYKNTLAIILEHLKSIKITILFLTLWSCSNDEFVAKFEKTLGKENSQTLTELVADFETDFLKRQYPNQDKVKAYEMFLTELRDGNTTDWKKISKESRSKFDNSSLKDEIYRYPDSVWIEKDTAKMIIKSSEPVVKNRFKYLNEDGSVEYLEGESSIPPMKHLDINWLLEREKNTPEFNSVGKYIQALYQIKDRDTFFKNFYKRKNSYGFIRPESLARVILHDSVDLNEYLVKRIIVLEIVY